MKSEWCVHRNSKKICARIFHIKWACSEVFNGVLVSFFLFPKGKVFLQQLNDWFGISEGFLINVINFFECFCKSSFSKLASFLVVVHDFVVEDTEVQGKSKSDWVASIEWLWELVGIVVSIKSSIFDLLESGIMGWFRNVSVVVSDHLVEESLWLVITGKTEALLLHDVYNLHALIVELFFNLFLVGGKSISKLLVLWVLLDGSDGSDGTSLGSNKIFESYWK